LSEDQIGKPIRFSDLESVVYLLMKMAYRDGIGDLLAEGVKVAAQKIGKGSEDFAIHVKGLEWTGYECRNAPSMMLAYLTSDIGAHHGRAWVLGHDLAGAFTSVHDLIVAGGDGEHQPKGIVTEQCAQYVIESQHERPIFDALGTCRLQLMELGFEGEHYSELYYYITGRKLTWEELLAVSERIWHLTRAFSVREIEGFGRQWDYPPKRLCEDPIQTGPNEGYCIPMEDIEFLLDAYYTARGWDADGIPTRATLERVGLKDVADTLNL
jgi:aldehyde:ferredoxin oxidoreductase